MELGALGELQKQSRGARDRSEEQMADHILANCPLYHPPNGTLGLAALDDDTVYLLKRTVLNILMTRLALTKKKNINTIFEYWR